jgi:predicted transcriptional regulator
VLKHLSDRVYNVSEIAEALALPASTATLHIKVLEDAGLIHTELQPAVRGTQKVCARSYDIVQVELSRGYEPVEQVLEVSMPVGAYVDCQVSPTCGLASAKGIIGLFDDPASFYEPERVSAQLLWFRKGYVEYRFPNRLPANTRAYSLQFSLEISSEAPLHHDDWPSDITLWVNGVEVGTWTSPADFGGERGVLTPDWWETWNSHYGLLKVWQINQAGSYVDGMRVSSIALEALNIDASSFVSVRIGVKPDARHVGGMNLFGRQFGNYPQDIVMRIRYH